MSHSLSLPNGQATPNSVFVCFVRFSQQIANICISSTDRMIFLFEAVFFCKIGNEVVGVSDYIG
jgi:hypothetical protein